MNDKKNIKKVGKCINNKKYLSTEEEFNLKLEKTVNNIKD